MKTIALDDNSDIKIHNGTFVILSGIDALVQRIENKLLLYRGEHHLDTRAGTPYIQEILTRQVNTQLIESIIRESILSVDGVQSITSLRINYDKTSRKANIEFSASTIYGAISKEVIV